MISREELVLGAVWGVLFWVVCQAVGFGFEESEAPHMRGDRIQVAYAPVLSHALER